MPLTKEKQQQIRDIFDAFGEEYAKAPKAKRNQVRGKYVRKLYKITKNPQDVRNEFANRLQEHHESLDTVKFDDQLSKTLSSYEK